MKKIPAIRACILRAELLLQASRDTRVWRDLDLATKRAEWLSGVYPVRSSIHTMVQVSPTSCLRALSQDLEQGEAR